MTDDKPSTALLKENLKQLRQEEIKLKQLIRDRQIADAHEAGIAWNCSECDKFQKRSKRNTWLSDEIQYEPFPDYHPLCYTCNVKKQAKERFKPFIGGQLTDMKSDEDGMFQTLIFSLEDQRFEFTFGYHQDYDGVINQWSRIEEVKESENAD